MNEPQVWTLIGVFAAGLFGMLTLMSTMFARMLRTEIGSVRTEIASVRTDVGSEVGSIRSEVSSIRSEVSSIRTEVDGVRTEMRSGFAAMTQRIDRLDADINALMKRSFGLDRD